MQKLHGLYVITDPILCADTLLNKVELAILGGAQIIQYRNKSASNDVQLHEASALQSLCLKHKRIFLINDDVELAIKVNADGVHLGQSDGDILATRKVLGDEKIIGVTCHSDVNAALKAQKQSANYVAFGRFYPSQTKPNAPAANIDILTLAKSQLKIPIAAIGGVNLENAKNLINTGADMLAVIHSIFAEKNIQLTAEKFRKLF